MGRLASGTAAIIITDSLGPDRTINSKLEGPGHQGSVMARRYLAFDIETAKEVPGADFNWKPHRPLGISCIASQSTGSDEPRVWMTRSVNETPAQHMSSADVAVFVRHIEDAVRKG